MPTGPLTWLGLAIGLTGLVLLARALFADRAKGRRRCPRCWYDLAGTDGLGCPECGRTARAERSLGRTRRRWGWAVLAVVIVGVGLGVAWGESVRDRGWARATPSVVLVLGWPDLGPDWRAEIDRRVDEDELPAWAYGRLVDQALGVVLRSAEQPVEADVRDEAFALLARIETTARTAETSRPWHRARPMGELRPDAIDRLVALMDHQDVRLRTEAMELLAVLGALRPAMVPGVLASLASDDGLEAAAAATLAGRMTGASGAALSRSPVTRPSQLGSASERAAAMAFAGGFDDDRTDPGAVRRRLEAGLDRDEDLVRATAIWGLAMLEAGGVDGGLDPVLELLEDLLAVPPPPGSGPTGPRWSDVRVQAIGALNVRPLDDRIRACFERMFADGDPMLGFHALDAAVHRETEARPLLEAILEWNRAVVLPSVGAYRRFEIVLRLGGDADLARSMLAQDVSMLLHQVDRLAEERVPFAIIRFIESADGFAITGAERAIERVAALLDDPSPAVGLAAATLYAWLGGDRQRATDVVLGLGNEVIDDPFALTMTDPATLAFAAFVRRGFVTDDAITGLLASNDSAKVLVGLFCVRFGGVGRAAHLPRLRSLAGRTDPTISARAEESIEAIEHALRLEAWRAEHGE